MKRQATILKIKNPRSRYIAIWRGDRKTVLAEGLKIQTVLKKATSTGKSFAMMAVPPIGQKCIY